MLGAFLLMASGCVKGGEKAAQTAPKWLPEAEQVYKASHGGSAFSKLKLSDEAARLKLSETISRVPAQRSTQEATALKQLVAISTFWKSVDEAARTVLARMSSADAEVPELANRSLRGSLEQQIYDFLVEQGRAVMKDVACDYAWVAMTGDEQDSVNQDFYGNGYVRIVEDDFREFPNLSDEMLVDAVKSKLESLRNKLVFPAELVDWYGYAKGLITKADELMSGRRTLIVHPDNSVYTRAMIYYVKGCLRPPGG